MGKVSSFRDAMAKALLQSVAADKSIVVISPDVARAVRIEKIKNKYESRFLSVGISEANMVGVAAGLASLGLTPVIVGFAMFVAEKPFEQIRNIVAYPNMNVKIIATHGGLCVGQDGATHQALEDMAILRTLPNVKVLCACDAGQTQQAIGAMLHESGPVYLRLGRDKAEKVYGTPSVFEIGGSDVLTEGNDVAILATGMMVSVSMEAAAALREKGIKASVVNMYSIKPLDKQRVLSMAKKCGCIVTVEDHSVVGGLGSAVAETLSQEMPIPIRFVGVNDVFGESGTQDDLYEKYGLDTASVIGAVKSVLGR